MASPVDNQSNQDLCSPVSFGLSPWGIMAWGTPPRRSRLQPEERSLTRALSLAPSPPWANASDAYPGTGDVTVSVKTIGIAAGWLN
jgi:hypothetical protein